MNVVVLVVFGLMVFDCVIWVWFRCSCNFDLVFCVLNLVWVGAFKDFALLIQKLPFIIGVSWILGVRRDILGVGVIYIWFGRACSGFCLLCLGFGLYCDFVLFVLCCLNLFVFIFYILWLLEVILILFCFAFVVLLFCLLVCCFFVFIAVSAFVVL